jgi:tol-pal system protein YbgF
MRRWRACLAAALFAAGCGGSLRSVQDDNHRLERELELLRVELRQSRRLLRDLRNRNDLLASQLAARSTAAPPVGADEAEPPPLPVEIRGPDAETPAPAPRYEVAGVDEQGVEIVYTGEALERSTLAPRRARRAAAAAGPARDPSGGDDELLASAAHDRLPVMRGQVPTVDRQLARAASRPAVTSAGAQQAEATADYTRYRQALTAGNHAYAIAGFRNFLARFGDHPYADNAQYWLAEAYYDQRDFRQALVEFRKVMEHHQQGNKVPDAMLKSGFCLLRLGEQAAARGMLQLLIQRFPASRPAVLARARLERLGTGANDPRRLHGEAN